MTSATIMGSMGFPAHARSVPVVSVSSTHL
jgi:hypothetical protein